MDKAEASAAPASPSTEPSATPAPADTASVQNAEKQPSASSPIHPAAAIKKILTSVPAAKTPDYDVVEPDDKAWFERMSAKEVIEGFESAEDTEKQSATSGESKPVGADKAADSTNSGAEAQSATDGGDGHKEDGTPSLPPDLVKRAAIYGLDEAGLKQFGSPEAAQTALDFWDKQISTIGKQALAKTEPKTGVEEVQERLARGDVQNKTEQVDNKADAVLAELSPEDYPDLVPHFKHVKQLAAAHKAEIEALRKEINGFKQYQEAQEYAALESRFDSWINKLGGEWESVYGKGELSGLDRSGNPYNMRKQLFDEAVTIQAGMNALGKKVNSVEEIWQRAHALVNRDRLAKVEREKIERSLKERKGTLGHRAVPAASNRPGMPGESPELDAAFRRMMGGMATRDEKRL